MNGDFKGDFSRDSFGMLRDFARELLQDTSRNKDLSTLRDLSLLGHFSRLLWQQGRVILDADLNEQIDILLHSLRSLAGDLIGPQGGPIYQDENHIDYTGLGLYTVTGGAEQGKLCGSALLAADNRHAERQPERLPGLSGCLGTPDHLT